MKERPILFSGAMVRALLDGRKTQTRRVLKPQPIRVSDGHGGSGGYFSCDKNGIGATEKCRVSDIWASYGSPYGTVGDQLWVRETWMPDAPHDGTWASTQFYDDRMSPLSDIPGRFRTPEHVNYRASWIYQELTGWKPSIHMPRWASRIQLEITGVRVERLQDISEEDAQAEGFHGPMTGTDWLGINQVGRLPSECYRLLWGSLNGLDSWLSNPWVWVIQFKRVKTQC